jgi:hypothetical protein
LDGVFEMNWNLVVFWFCTIFELCLAIFSIVALSQGAGWFWSFPLAIASGAFALLMTLALTEGF